MNAKNFALMLVIALCILGLTSYWYISSDMTELEEGAVPEPAVSAPIGVRDILNNAEFSQGILRAVEAQDDAEFDRLHAKAEQIAIAAGLPPHEADMIVGEQGARYIRFRAKRQLFWRAFEARFNQFEPIADLKEAYPQARDLFDRADALIAQRNAEIVAIATANAGTDATQDELDAQLKLAREQWLQSAKEAQEMGSVEDAGQRQ